MKTYIVYNQGIEVGMLQAGSHNAAEKKAQKRYGPGQSRIEAYLRVNPWMSREQAIKNLTSQISVAYTEV